MLLKNQQKITKIVFKSFSMNVINSSFDGLSEHHIIYSQGFDVIRGH